MSSQKCPQCGLVNFSSAMECKRCQGSLDKNAASEAAQLPTAPNSTHPANHQSGTEPHRQCVTDVQYPIETESGASSRILPAAGVLTLLFALSFFVKTMIWTKRIDLAISRNEAVSTRAITDTLLDTQAVADNSKQKTVTNIPPIKIPQVPSSAPSPVPDPAYKSTVEPPAALSEPSNPQSVSTPKPQGVYQMYSALDRLANTQQAPSTNPLREPMTVSGGVLNGKAVNLVKPIYPPAASAVRAAGTVNVQVTIDVDGNVISAGAVSGHPLLKQSAEYAARSSKFNPTSLSGEKVKVVGVIVYNFTAQQF